jgi:hypothetical protein
MNAFYASKNFDAFIVVRSSQPWEPEQKTLTQNDRVFREKINEAQVSRSIRGR